jgi:hypothetical protein
VWLHPDGHTLVVVANGCLYAFDANTRQRRSDPGAGVHGDIEALLEAPPWLVLATYTNVIVVLEHEVWESPRVALDGIRNLRVADGILYGEGWVGYEEEDYEPFRIDLVGKAVLTKPYA